MSNKYWAMSKWIKEHPSLAADAIERLQTALRGGLILVEHQGPLGIDTETPAVIRWRKEARVALEPIEKAHYSVADTAASRETAHDE